MCKGAKRRLYHTRLTEHILVAYNVVTDFGIAIDHVSGTLDPLDIKASLDLFGALFQKSVELFEKAHLWCKSKETFVPRM